MTHPVDGCHPLRVTELVQTLVRSWAGFTSCGLRGLRLVDEAGGSFGCDESGDQFPRLASTRGVGARRGYRPHVKELHAGDLYSGLRLISTNDGAVVSHLKLRSKAQLARPHGESGLDQARRCREHSCEL